MPVLQNVVLHFQKRVETVVLLRNRAQKGGCKFWRTEITSKANSGLATVCSEQLHSNIDAFEGDSTDVKFVEKEPGGDVRESPKDRGPMSVVIAPEYMWT